jgi:hypothetical protein
MITRTLVSKWNTFSKIEGNVLRKAFCWMLMAVGLWNMALMYLPGQGFTYPIEFGDRNHNRYLPEVKKSSHYEIPNSDGYDGKAYVQIAMRPNLGDPALSKVVDGLPYRARRILFLWSAWLLGLGKPYWIMNAYAVQNILSWILLSVLLFRWFPPTDWQNCFRWSAVLFSFGLIFSVRSALLDGPSLLLVALAMAFIESKRPWMGAAILGIAGLGKETNLLCGFGTPLFKRPSIGNALKAGAQLILIAAPIVIWTLILTKWVGHGTDPGARNFAAPLQGLIGKFHEISANLSVHGFQYVQFDFFSILGLLIQCSFFIVRVRLRDPWWRIGASYVVLMFFLGDGVWEGYPSASVRALLPITLAFNILVPRKGWWLLLLLAGNIGVLGSIDLLKPPDREDCVVKDLAGLRTNLETGDRLGALFGQNNWWGQERSHFNSWNWSRGNSSITINNPQRFPINSDITLFVLAADARGASILMNNEILWHAALAPGKGIWVNMNNVVLPPGNLVLSFESDRPAAYPNEVDTRKVTFSVRNLEIALKGLSK